MSVEAAAKYGNCEVSSNAIYTGIIKLGNVM